MMRRMLAAACSALRWSSSMVKRCGAALRDAYEWRRCCSGGEVREGAKCAASRESGSLVESERTRKEQGRKREEEAWPAHFFFQNDKAGSRTDAELPWVRAEDPTAPRIIIKQSEL